MATALSIIKNWFKTGLKPTQSQFWATWDSFWHKDEKIPVSAVDKLQYYLDQKAEQQAFTNHIDSTNKEFIGIKKQINTMQPRIQVVELTSNTILNNYHQGCILSINGKVTLTIPKGLENTFVSCVIDVVSGTCTIAHEVGVEINGGFALILNAGDMTSLYKRTEMADLYRLR